MRCYNRRDARSGVSDSDFASGVLFETTPRVVSTFNYYDTMGWSLVIPDSIRRSTILVDSTGCIHE